MHDQPLSASVGAMINYGMRCLAATRLLGCAFDAPDYVVHGMAVCYWGHSERIWENLHVLHPAPRACGANDQVVHWYDTYTRG